MIHMDAVSEAHCQRLYAVKSFENQAGRKTSYKRLSKKGRRADALALRADERRDKLRKATGSGKYALIRRCLNGGTHMFTCICN